MAKTCGYCKGTCQEEALKCGNCGAPFSLEDSRETDYRSCPYCRRKLLALGSPACNYCGRRLPEEYIKARESDLLRISGVEEGNKSAEPDSKVDEILRQAVRRDRGQSSPIIDLIDLKNLTDLF
jgi:DNA-directed RNA polymerase subunit RPC12/RpoP